MSESTQSGEIIKQSFQERVVDRVSKIRSEARQNNIIAGFGAITEKFGLALGGYNIVKEVLLSQAIHASGFVTPEQVVASDAIKLGYIVAGGTILFSEFIQRSYGRSVKQLDGVANHLEAQIILDTLKENKK